ncbi:MAG: hypothetical protein H7X70_00130 [Candidatus Kapabacteria bacterium]|nr:hypothetical protein [Candidatus Kapabacteria bacterium]
MKIISTLVFVLLLAPSLIHAQGLISGWMQGQGKTAAALTGFTESYNKYYVGQQQTYNPQLGTITTSGVTLYLGAGITDWLDVVVNVPYVSASSTGGLWETVSGMQDLQAGLKIRPLSLKIDESRLDLILGGVYSTPISNYTPDSPVTIGHQASGIDGRIVAQYSTNQGIFLMVGMGYMARGRVALDRGFEVDVPDAIESVGRIGWGSASWYSDVWLQNVVAQSGSNIGPGVSFPSNAQSLTRIGATLAYRIISDLSVIAGASGTVSGRNVGHSTRFTFGVAYDLPIWNGVSL